MRTSIDIPDVLFRRVKSVMAKRGMTFRSLVIHALAQALDDKKTKPFVLREASAGYNAGKQGGVSIQTVNKAIVNSREPKRGH